MTQPLRPRFRPLAVSLALAFLANGPGLCAQNQVVGEVPLPPVPAEVVDDLLPQPVGGLLPQPVRMFEISSDQFDTLVFGNNARPRRAGAPQEWPNSLIESQLTLRVDDIDRTCKVSPDQRAKLLLAGRGDVRRFMDRVDEKRKKFEGVRKDRNKFGMFHQELQPLRLAFSGGLFGTSSLLEKTLRRTLDEEQAEKYQGALRERAAYRYGAAVDFLSTKLARALGLSVDQRERLARLIKDETRPPKSMGTQDFNVASYQASQVPMAKYEAILDDAQIKVLERQLPMWQRNDVVLRRQGYVPDDTPAGKGR
ncbi:MAG: hypothetical protein WKF75_09230 [Singulisphaera sp.]